MPQLRRDHPRQRAPRRGVDRHGPQELASNRHPTHYEEVSTISGETHRGIENRLHWVRDVSYGEDLSQVHTGHGPAVMATLRNLAISLLRRAGATNIAAACRHLNRHPARVLPMIM